MTQLILNRRSFIMGTGASLILPATAKASWFGWTKSIDNAPVYSDGDMQKAMNDFYSYISEQQKYFKNHNNAEKLASAYEQTKASGKYLSGYLDGKEWKRNPDGEWEIVPLPPSIEDSLKKVSKEPIKLPEMDDVTYMKSMGYIGYR